MTLVFSWYVDTFKLNAFHGGVVHIDAVTKPELWKLAACRTTHIGGGGPVDGRASLFYLAE